MKEKEVNLTASQKISDKLNSFIGAHAKMIIGIFAVVIILVIVLAVVITIAYIQMNRLNNKLMQVRYLIFDSDLFEKEVWTESERATAVEYAKDSLSFMQINTIAYVFSLVNLFVLTLFISMFIS